MSRDTLIWLALAAGAVIAWQRRAVAVAAAPQQGALAGGGGTFAALGIEPAVEEAAPLMMAAADAGGALGEALQNVIAPRWNNYNRFDHVGYVWTGEESLL